MLLKGDLGRRAFRQLLDVCRTEHDLEGFEPASLDPLAKLHPRPAVAVGRVARPFQRRARLCDEPDGGLPHVRSRRRDLARLRVDRAVDLDPDRREQVGQQGAVDGELEPRGRGLAGPRFLPIVKTARPGSTHTNGV